MLMPTLLYRSFGPRSRVAGITAASLLFASSMSSTASAATAATTSYQPRHSSWPYHPSDFQRQDPSSDTSFYDAPRFVTHIDDAAISSLRKYYDQVLPRKGRILDFCSSWVSHYPPAIEEAVEKDELKVIGMGMNQKELEANKVLNAGRILQDLNVDPVVPLTVCNERAASGMSMDVKEDDLLDASTCVVSIDYLIHPVEVLSSLRERTRKGGSVHLIISNRCFPTKAVGRWLRVGEPERLNMVGDYLWFSGWRNIEIIDLKAGEDNETDQQPGGLSSFLKSMGMGGTDPLWAVRASNDDVH